MKLISYISDYFFSKKMRNKPLNRVEDNSGVIITFGELNAYGNLINYTNWLMSVISYSHDVGIELNKLIDLIDRGIIKGLGWYNESVFISIYKNALSKEEKKEVEDNFLSKNSELIDKK